MSFSNEPAFDEPETKSIVNALGTSLRHQIFPLLSTLFILEQVAGKIRTLFLQFSETTAHDYAAKM